MTRDEALMWQAGSEPALYAAQTYAAIAALRERLARPVHKEVDDLANAPDNTGGIEMIDTRELRKLAKAATPPGGWYVELGDYIYGEKDVTDGEEWQPVIANTEEGGPVNFEVSVAAFISVANPAAVLELLDRLEAAERKCDALRAKVEAMEQQEPVAWVRKLGLDLPSVVCVTDLKYRPSDTPESSYIPLYLAPGAQPAPSVPTGWKLVPIEPTPEMKTAGIGVEVYQASPPSTDCLTWGEVEAIYSAMLAAAPEAKP